jgi:hypothetical protein
MHLDEVYERCAFIINIQRVEGEIMTGVLMAVQDDGVIVDERNRVIQRRLIIVQLASYLRDAP